MRLPGSYNRKYDPARLVRMEWSNKNRYSLGDLLRVCPAEPLRHTRRSSMRVSGTLSVDVDQDAYAQLRTAYLARLEPADMFDLDLSITEARHGTALSLAGLLHNGEREESELVEIISCLWDEYFDRAPREGEIEEIVKATLERKPFIPLSRAEWELQQSIAAAPERLRNSKLVQRGILRCKPRQRA